MSSLRERGKRSEEQVDERKKKYRIRGKAKDIAEKNNRFPSPPAL